jgi:hypothetical protein
MHEVPSQSAHITHRHYAVSGDLVLDVEVELHPIGLRRVVLNGIQVKEQASRTCGKGVESFGGEGSIQFTLISVEGSPGEEGRHTQGRKVQESRQDQVTEDPETASNGCLSVPKGIPGKTDARRKVAPTEVGHFAEEPIAQDQVIFASGERVGNPGLLSLQLTDLRGELIAQPQIQHEVGADPVFVLNISTPD